MFLTEQEIFIASVSLGCLSFISICHEISPRARLPWAGETNTSPDSLVKALAAVIPLSLGSSCLWMALQLCTASTSSFSSTQQEPL